MTIPTARDVEELLALITDTFGPKRADITNRALRNAAIHAAAGYPPGRSHNTPAGDAALECPIHQCDLTDCHRAAKHRNATPDQQARGKCTGVPVPHRPDPTGNAATRPDNADRDAHELQAAITRISHELTTYRRLLFAVAGIRTDSRGLELDNTPICTSCHRNHGHRTPATTRTDANGQLTEKLQLCRWCTKWATDHGTLPPLETLRRHHQGEPIRTRPTTRKTPT